MTLPDFCRVTIDEAMVMLSIPARRFERSQPGNPKLRNKTKKPNHTKQKKTRELLIFLPQAYQVE